MGTVPNNFDSPIHLVKLRDTDIDNGSNIEELLKPVQSLPLDLDSDYSDISDIFEEFHKDSFLRPNADPIKKHLSKLEADWKTVETFTDDFKKTMMTLREKLQVNNPLFDEDEVIEGILNAPTSHQKLDISNRESPIPIQPQKDEISETSSTSLVWQRLLKNSEGRFKVSPPVFDAFRQEKKHWLERPPISWKLVDDCRLKCEKWLDDIVRMDGDY